MTKKDIIYSLAVGELTSWFFILIIKNPYIAELGKIAILKNIVWYFLIIFPLLFLFGIVAAFYASKIVKPLFQLGRFLEIGVLNTIMDLGILNLLIFATGVTGGLRIAPLNIISFLSAATNSYFWNKHWTFENKEKASGQEFSKFLIVSAIGIGINTGVVVLGTSLMAPFFGLSGGAWANVVKLSATVFSMAWNFAGYKFIVFKK